MAQALVTALQATLKAARISLSWHIQYDSNQPVPDSGQMPTLIALSSGSCESAQADLKRALITAMDESIIQQHSLSSFDTLTSGRISAAQRALANLTSTCVITIPLAVDNQAIGAICIELPAATMPAGDVSTRRRLANIISFTEALLPACARLMSLTRQDRPSIRNLIRQRLRHKPADSREHRWRRTAWTAAAITIAVGLLVPFEQPITSPARIEGAIEREITAPIDGFLESVAVRPGDTVVADQVLISLSRRELDIELGQLEAELQQHQAQANAAMSAGDRATMADAQALANQTKAKLALSRFQLEQTSIRAPLAGTILQGDLSERENTPVDRGEVLFKLAPDKKLRVIIEVAEEDIIDVKNHQTGELALSALPWQRFPLVVERIAPVATVIEDRNVVEVLASITDHPEAVKPGQRGVVHLSYKHQSLLTRWTGKLLDLIARWWWRWQPW